MVWESAFNAKSSGKNTLTSAALELSCYFYRDSRLFSKIPQSLRWMLANASAILVLQSEMEIKQIKKACNLGDNILWTVREQKKGVKCTFLKLKPCRTCCNGACLFVDWTRQWAVRGGRAQHLVWQYGHFLQKFSTAPAQRLFINTNILPFWWWTFAGV